MSTSNWLIVVSTVLYAAIACAALYEGNKAKALVFTGYTLANLGFILSD